MLSNRRWYLLAEDKRLTFSDAKSYCKAHGGYIVDVSSESEYITLSIKLGKCSNMILHHVMVHYITWPKKEYSVLTDHCLYFQLIASMLKAFIIGALVQCGSATRQDQSIFQENGVLVMRKVSPIIVELVCTYQHPEA